MKTAALIIGVVGGFLMLGLGLSCYLKYQDSSRVVAHIDSLVGEKSPSAPPWVKRLGMAAYVLGGAGLLSLVGAVLVLYDNRKLGGVAMALAGGGSFAITFSPASAVLGTLAVVGGVLALISCWTRARPSRRTVGR